MDAPAGVQGHAGFNKATADEVTGSFATSCGVWKMPHEHVIDLEKKRK